MGSTSRAHVPLFGMAIVALAAGCSGGGGGGSPTPVTTASTPVATAATSPPIGAPSPVSTQATTAQTVTSRPLASGDEFSYTGKMLSTTQYNGADPQPVSTALAAVAQTVTLKGPVTQNGVSNLTDVHVVEVDTSPLQALTVTTDDYEALTAAGSGQDLTLASSDETTSNGYAQSVTYAAPITLDVLPETSGATFTNSPAQTIAETLPGAYTTKRSIASDGSYSDTETFPNDPNVSGGTPMTATITEGAAGNGTYSLPLSSYASNVSVAVGTPAPTVNTIPLTLTVPDPSQTPMTASVPVWYATPVKLYTESDVQTGSKPIPGPCAVPATIATAANALVTQIERVDTVLGTDEKSAQIAYVAATPGLVCLQLTDTTESFYDYSGISEDGIGFSGSATVPLEVDTVQETIGLTAAPTLVSGEARASGAAAVRAAALRGAFDAEIGRLRAARAERAYHALATRLRSGR